MSPEVPFVTGSFKCDTMFRNMDLAMQVVALATRVERFLSAIRDQAALAWLIREGSTVLVDDGRKLPYGYYTVIRHYQPAVAPGEPYCLCLKPVDGKLLHPRIPLDSVKVQPDFRAAFSTWADGPRARWAPYLPGMCKAGLGPVELLRMADLIESDWGVIAWDDYDSEGIPAEWFARHLRSLAENRHWSAVRLGPTAAVTRFNRTGQLPQAALRDTDRDELTAGVAAAFLPNPLAADGSWIGPGTVEKT